LSFCPFVLEAYVPVPFRLTVCGLPPPSSLILIFAILVPVAVGVNVTEIVQLALAAMLVPQVLVSEKSALFAPLMAIPINWVLPVFVSVTFCGALAVPTG
jgi:hypothetical protein